MAESELDRQIRRFRERLLSGGMTVVNASGELGTDRVVVLTQYTHGEWTVAIKPATGATVERADLLRIRLNESSTPEVNADKLDKVWAQLKVLG